MFTNVIANMPNPLVIPVPIVVPDPFLIVIRVFVSPVPVMVGVASAVTNGAEKSPPAEVTVGATGAVTSRTVIDTDLVNVRVPVDVNLISVPCTRTDPVNMCVPPVKSPVPATNEDITVPVLPAASRIAYPCSRLERSIPAVLLAFPDCTSNVSVHLLARE